MGATEKKHGGQGLLRAALAVSVPTEGNPPRGIFWIWGLARYSIPPPNRARGRS